VSGYGDARGISNCANEFICLKNVPWHCSWMDQLYASKLTSKGDTSNVLLFHLFTNMKDSVKVLFNRRQYLDHYRLNYLSVTTGHEDLRPFLRSEKQEQH